MTTQPPNPLPPDPFSGVITARDVYDVVRETQADVRLSLNRLSTVETAQADQETRIRALERWRWGTGAALALAVLAVAAGDSPISSLIP